MSKQTPEAWHARCLRQESEALTAAVRGLEFALGFYEGEKAGFSQGVNANALALRAVEEPTGTPVEPAS